ncbi:MAG: ShlB/FhaC/HecB family hemolysin secretion/activation protein [Coleofasciculaceae cyanobacterium]
MRFTLQLSVLAGIFSMGILPCYATTPVSSDADTKLQQEDSASFSLLQTAQTSPLNQPENLQPNPNRDRFLQPQTPSLPIPKPTEIPVTPTPTSEPSTDTNIVPIQVKRIEVVGSTILIEQLQKIIKPLEGRTVTFNELTNAVEAINKLYLEQGYTSSRAVLEPQTIANGIVKILAVEGSIERIEVEGTRRLNPNYVRSRVKLGVGTPLNTNKLEDQLRLLRADPLFKTVEATLRSGSGEGKSILVVRVVEANPFQANLSVDNYSPPSIGSERLGINASYRNLTGNGDVLSGSYYRTTTGGADVFDFSYRVPLNAMNGTLELRAAPNRNNVTQAPFKALDIRGESQLYEISYRQPLVRTTREEFALSLGFAYQNGQTFTFAGPTPFSIGPDEQGVSRTSVIKFGQDYVRRDAGGAWGLRSLFSFGTGTLDATINPDPIPDGRFFSWLGQVQRVQTLNDNNLLILQADLQLTPNSLLPSQQFVIGGGQSVRGYRQNVRAGDNGVRFSIENRMTLQRDEIGNSVFQLAPFVDLGTVWNVSDNPNKLQRQTFLAGAGLGLIYSPLPKLSLRLDYGLPLINLSDRGNNAQDSGFYFSANYQL